MQKSMLRTSPAVVRRQTIYLTEPVGIKKQCYLIEVSVLLCLSVPARKDRTFETSKITYKLAWAKARDDAIRGNEDLGQTLYRAAVQLYREAKGGRVPARP